MTFDTSWNEEVDIYPIEGHPELFRDEHPQGQHCLFQTCALCKKEHLLEDTFPVSTFGEYCNECFYQIVNARMEFHDDRYERAMDYEAHLRELDPPNVTKTMRQQIFARDGHACRYCGIGGELAIDHIHPQSRGGKHALSNLATACRSCNSRKHDRAPEEAGMPLRPVPEAQA